MQAKDISDKVLLEAIHKAQLLMQEKYPEWAKANTSEVWSTLWDICNFIPEFPQKVVLAKLKSAVRRKVIHGCTCGCRGDFYPV